LIDTYIEIMVANSIWIVWSFRLACGEWLKIKTAQVKQNGGLEPRPVPELLFQYKLAIPVGFILQTFRWQV